MTTDQTVETPPPEEDDSTDVADPGASIDLISGLSPNVKQWLLGQIQEKPLEVDSTMDQAAEKINMGIAMLVVQRLASLSQTFEFLQKVEEGLFDPDRVPNMDSKELMATYRSISKDSSEFLEFVRKFTLQNKEMFSQKSQADELAGILRELDPAVLQMLLKILSRKGAGTTVHDLQGVEAELPAPEPPTPSRRPTSGPKRGGDRKPFTLFDELMKDEDPPS